MARSPVWRLSSSYKGNGEKAGGAVGGALPAGTGVSWRSGAMSRAGHRCGEVSRPRHAYGRTSPLLSPFRVPGDLWSGVSAGSETHAERGGAVFARGRRPTPSAKCARIREYQETSCKVRTAWGYSLLAGREQRGRVDLASAGWKGGSPGVSRPCSRRGASSGSG